MYKWLARRCRIDLDKQIEDEIYECQRQLLEAEGIQERANANVAMLRTRLARLSKRTQAKTRSDKAVITEANAVVERARTRSPKQGAIA